MVHSWCNPCWLLHWFKPVTYKTALHFSPSIELNTRVVIESVFAIREKRSSVPPPRSLFESHPRQFNFFVPAEEPICTVFGAAH